MQDSPHGDFALKTYAGMRDQLLGELPNALEIRIDPAYALNPHQGRQRSAHAIRTPAELFADYCAEVKVDDPRVARLFDDLHDQLSGRG